MITSSTARKPYCMASCDLEGCYDRIIHNAAAIALIRVGVPKQKVFSMFTSIQKMIHKIRTVYGDSDISYGGEDIGDWENFPQGVLQGNASGPQIWSILSSIIFSIFGRKDSELTFAPVCQSRSFFSLDTHTSTTATSSRHKTTLLLPFNQCKK